MGWYQLFHLGDPSLTLPAGSAIAAWLLAARAWRAAVGWMLMYGLALGLVAASKIAFLGWATGLPALQFKALSGHATGFAAVFPTICYLAVPARAAGLRKLAARAALLLAAVVAAGLVHADEHTLAEAAGGWLVGTVVFVGSARLIRSASAQGASSALSGPWALWSALRALRALRSQRASEVSTDSEALGASELSGASGASRTPEAARAAEHPVAPRADTGTVQPALPVVLDSASTVLPPSALPVTARSAAVPAGLTMACATLAFVATAWMLRSAPLNYWMIKVALVLSGNAAPVPWDHCG